MLDLDLITRLDDSQWFETVARKPQVSEGNSVALIAEFEGPGCVYRFRCGKAEGRLRISLDGKLLIDMPAHEFFTSGKFPFVEPLTQRTPRLSYFCFLPMPFQKSFRAEIEPDPEGKTGSHWQVTSRRYSDETKVQTFRWDWSVSEKAALERVRKAWIDPGLIDTEAAGGLETVSCSGIVESGQVLVLAKLPGPGIVSRFRLRAVSSDPFIGRRGLLKIFWDDAKEPSVQAPLADFFGSGVGGLEYHSWSAGMEADGSFYCRFRMPYARSARIELANLSGQAIDSVVSEVAYRPLESFAENLAYFHAGWRQELTSSEPRLPHLLGPEDFLVLRTVGRGRFAGLHLNVFNYYPRWWGEGNPRIWIDQDPSLEERPRFHGTGTEEYFNGGWCGFNRNPMSTFVPYAASDVGRPSYPAEGICTIGPHLLNTWHIQDFPIFHESLTFTLQHHNRNGEGLDGSINLYSAVAYWYQERPISAVKAMDLSEPGVQLTSQDELFTRPQPEFERVRKLHRQAGDEASAERVLQLIAGFQYWHDPSLSPEIEQMLIDRRFTDLITSPRLRGLSRYIRSQL